MRALLGWVGRHMIFLVVIVAILVAGKAFQEQLTEFRKVTIELDRLGERQSLLKKSLNEESVAAKQRLKGLDRKAKEKLESRLKAIADEIAALERQRGALQTVGKMLTGGALDTAKAQVKIIVLRKEESYVQGLLAILSAEDELKRLLGTHQAAYVALMANEAAQEQVKVNHPVASRVFGTAAHRHLAQLRAQHGPLYQGNQRAFDRYEAQERDMREREGKVFQPFSISETEVMNPLQAAASDLERRLQSNWASKLSKPVTEVLPAALMILVGIVFGPIAIKLFLYYVVAPLASKRPSVQIVPEAKGELGHGDHSGVVPGEGSISAVSHEVTVGPSQEMLIHPEYLQSTADAASKRTKWLLDWSLPLSSLASGMFALTRIRSISDQSFVVSATKDPLSEVGLISVPRLGAVVLQPRSLVGVIQPLDCPVRITRHWRLGSVNAWLTLQLRYLVFHGPVTLIVKGCRGVRLEMPTSGRSINQAATMGFSANLAYSVRRYETFMPYAFGKQELFNDSFAGGPGFCIYEESPNFGKGGGITGRGLEGVLDSMLKVFGI